MFVPRTTTIDPEPATTALGELVPVIELWDAWAFAEIDTEVALKRWWDATPAESASAYAAYIAALEREEHAAAVLEAQVKHAA